jgi:D-alanyl-D-alanine dipeptidase
LSFELRYATKNNFTGRILYAVDTTYLRKGTADKLKQAAAEFERDGYHLLIWDAYRPPSVQLELWQIVNDSRYIANPFNGWSYHNRGSAIDCTLLDRNGAFVEMPTGFDSFTAKADRNYNDVTREQAANAVYLESVMRKHGFLSIQTEWWHFNDSDKYDLAYSVSTPYLNE